MTLWRARVVVLVLCTAGWVNALSAQSASTGENASEVIANIPSPLSLELRPAVDIPLGESAQYFSTGGGLNINVDYRFPNTIFFVLGGAGYTYAPTQSSSTLSMAVARGGGGIFFPLTNVVGLLAYASGGYWFAAYNDFSLSSTNPYIAGGGGVQFSLGPFFALSVGAHYENYLGLYQGINVGISTSVPLGNLGGNVGIPSVQLRPAFPVFYKYYDDHPIGTLQVKSNLRVPAEHLNVQVFIKQFMDNPKQIAVPGSLAPGESKTIDLYALFNDKLLGITEGTKVSTEVIFSFDVNGKTYTDKKYVTLDMLGRNAMTWDDNRKAAAFVTAKEPLVLDFARAITSYVKSKENRAINEGLLAAMALHEALDLYGINYVHNPVSSYEDTSKNTSMIDFLQFPRETLARKAGDCSDISILYSALLQSVGVDAAFVTIPGHIFVAVNTGLSPKQAIASLIPQNRFIQHKGTAWIPVEITMRGQGFTKAWDLGAKEWYENASSGKAGFYPVKEAWAAYQPVGVPGAAQPATLPGTSEIFTAYHGEMGRYIDAAISPLVARYEAQIEASGSIGARNSLGVLYAKYGQSQKAAAQFRAILAQRDYLPALLNMGNLSFINQNWRQAQSYYQKALDIDPRNPRTLLAIARVSRELENHQLAQASYEKLKALSPALAKQYNYLAEGAQTGARAADEAAMRTAVIWEAE